MTEAAAPTRLQRWLSTRGSRFAQTAGAFLLAACSTPPSSEREAVTQPADVAALAQALDLPRLSSDAPLDLQLGAASAYDGYSVRPLSFVALPDFRASAALWQPKGSGPFPAVLVLPGHFGEGKSSGECQEAAHALAARGVAALAVDMPGVEEWDQPGRQIHFEAGAHNRAVLAAAGSSALALQLQVARRGLQALQRALPTGRLAVTGASGGAVLSFYLLLLEPSLSGGAMVSFVPLPREARAGGCPCDALPGWPGPDASLLAALEKPSIWVSELDQARPAGLPANARFEVVAGPHSYTAAQRAAVLPWLDELLAHEVADPRRAEKGLRAPPYTPGEALRSPAEGGASIFELALRIGGPRTWSPAPLESVPYELDCAGEGPVVITAGAREDDRDALLGAGLQACALQLAEDELWQAQALITGRAAADRPAGALRQAWRQRAALGIYARGAWAVAAAASGAPTVLRDPQRSLQELDPQRDPTWVHVPGAWWGGLDALYEGALATGSDPATLSGALRSRQAP